MTYALLFNSTDRGLSDITICVKSGEDIKTYHAHKAILANRSTWIYTRFSSDTEPNTLELEEKNLHHFHLLMKYFYQHDVRDSANATLKKLEDAVAVYRLAEKYEAQSIMNEALANFSRVTSNLGALSWKEKGILIKAHYSQYSGSDKRMGHVIVKCLPGSGQGRDFINSDDCGKLFEEYAEFLRDLIIVAREHRVKLF